jgi:2-oxoglutarate dehydrogenase E2 component (dihydrolipoamide succinyltransferase)
VTEVLIPVLNANDEEYVLTERLVPDGARVQAGDAIAVVETSKAASELVCDEPGVLHWLAEVMSSCRPGQPVARIAVPGSALPGSALPGLREPGYAEAQDPSGITITNAARDLLLKHGISAAQVAESGRKLIRVAEVEAILREGAAAALRPETAAAGPALPRQQLAVARAVSRSHATIPSAFLAMKVEAPWVAVPDTSARPAPAARGLAELVIGAVAAVAGAFPMMFTRVAEDLTLTSPGSVDIGVTIDLGNGLTIPAIPAADTLNVSDIATALMNLRMKARRGKLTDEDLGAPCIVVALQQEAGVVLSIPIVYPGNVCALSIGALAWEIVLGPTGQLVPRACFQLGISYDHRVVNGRDAALFAASIRDHLTQIAPAGPESFR